MSKLKNKISSLDGKISSYKKKHKMVEKSDQDISSFKYATMICSDIIAGILVGTVLGYQIDKIFNTKPLFFIVLMLLGMVGGMWNIFKRINK